jgi:hypothetical protein
MTIHTTLRYADADADAAIAFLTDALGLTSQDTHRDDAGRVSHATRPGHPAPAGCSGRRSARAPGVVACCDLDGVRTIVDVGGGNGTLLAAFLAAHPALRATLLDTPDTVAGLTDLPDRATPVAGDFFTCVPTADAHVLKSVIHDWDDERSVAILTRVREAMPPHGRLFLVEPVLAETVAGLAEQRVTVLSDLNMLVCTGGRERTRAEFTALLDAAGLRIVELTRVPPPTGFSVLRAVPA